MIKREYNHKKIEKKWQKEWERKKVFQAKDSRTKRASSSKKKFYSLIEFPYPSGEGLHVGHVRSNTAMDIVSRKRRMEGYNVLYPIGWDAFGLPTENYAIKTGISPEIVTKRNTDNFRRQLKSLGFSFDWSREVNTTDPKYYKWTQWIFLQLLKKGLAYKAKIAVNWCPKDKVGLANEEVINGCCERCGTPVEKKEKEQWLLRITKYAERLDKDLDDVDYQEKIKIQQRNWIGKSEGAEIDFEIWRGSEKIKVYTTRPDTIFGATYIVLAPEHEIIEKLWGQIENGEEVLRYIEEVEKKPEIERTGEGNEKTGVRIVGISAVNPANKEVIPIYIADYVLATYGTGAIMAVPAHDERDFEFAKKYNLPIKRVVSPYLVDKKDPPMNGKKTVHKKVVQCVVESPDGSKILVLKWQKFAWVSFISGGIDGNEKPEDTAEREIAEETGYVDFKSVKLTGYNFFSTYHATHKDENREAEVCVVKVRLNSERKIDVKRSENEKFEAKWVSVQDARKTVNQVEAPIIWEIYGGEERAYEGEGKLIDSAQFSGSISQKAKKEISNFVNGKWTTKYKLRDWVFSRQRYWGEPIPVVHCGYCAQTDPSSQGVVPLMEKDLPLILPKLKNYQPRDDGESPLASATSWVVVKCPKCGRMAKRETDTMPNWAGSSWYFLRYIDPKNNKQLADIKKLKYWMPVDWYNGGMEHTTLHLLYSRFWQKFLYDIGVVPGKEPYRKRTSHGLILAGAGEKMSKSKGNIVNPDEVVKMYGADTLRLYEMFMGPFSEAIAWNEDNIFGVMRFIERVWRMRERIKHGTNTRMNANDTNKFKILLNKTIKKVTDDIESMSFNTAVSAMMILLNEMEKQEVISRKHFEIFLKILSPFAPHISEELWSLLGNRKMIIFEKWPKYDKNKLQEKEVRIAVQINGRVRGVCVLSHNAGEGEAVRLAREIPDIEKWFIGKEIKRVVYVPNKILNFLI